VTGEWRKFHNEELRNLYCSPNIIKMIRFKRTRWVGHVARIGEIRNTYAVFVGKLKTGVHSEDLGVDGRIILKWILGK
jgi:hypothetical protein